MRPQVSLCLATSLDGKIAAKPGAPPDFTSREDLAKLFRLRAASDALLIGAGTVRSEQVLPLVRDEELAARRVANGLPRHPAAVIVSGSLDLPWDGRYFRYRKQRMFLLTGTASQTAHQQAGEHDLEILETGNPLSLTRGLEMLFELGFRQLLAEGGGRLTHALLAEDLVDRAYLTIAPLFIGGVQTPNLVKGDLLPANHFKLADCQRIGDELHLTYDRA